MTRKEKTIAGLVLVVNLSVGAWLARDAELGELATGGASVGEAQAVVDIRGVESVASSGSDDAGTRLAVVRSESPRAPD